MNVLKINIPDGYKINDLDKSTGEITFSPIPKTIKERIKTFDDVLKENGVTRKKFEKSCEGLPPHKIAANMVEEIVKAFNEGWTPNWSDSSQYKYVPWFNMGSSSGVGFSYRYYAAWLTLSNVGSRLCYKSSDLAKHAANLFLDVYKDFLTA